MSELTAILIGAGERGHHNYGRWALDHPGHLSFVAVVDPDPVRRHRFAAAHALDEPAQFSSLEALVERGRLADVAVVTSPDRHHYPAAVALLRLGYHLILEKPMAATMSEVEQLVALTQRTDRIVQVAHVLRYTPFFRTLNELVTSGRIGDIVTVEHRENVAAWHMAHSFVRGNWSTAAQSTPLIVQKCSHDFDILAWNLDSPVRRVSSVGSLFHFRPDRRPVDATDRCSDGCPVADCPFDARRIYLTDQVGGWPIHVITDDYSMAGRERALREGPYGRCVYTAGSDVVDNQVVTMQLDSGASAVLVFHGHSHEEQRTMRYDGTRATVRGVFGRRQHIEIIDHAKGAAERVPVPHARGGHGGGDSGLIATFVEAVQSGGSVPTNPAVSLESHHLAFAAEHSRVTGEIVDMAAWRAGTGK